MKSGTKKTDSPLAASSRLAFQEVFDNVKSILKFHVLIESHVKSGEEGLNPYQVLLFRFRYIVRYFLFLVFSSEKFLSEVKDDGTIFICCAKTKKLKREKLHA